MQRRSASVLALLVTTAVISAIAPQSSAVTIQRAAGDVIEVDVVSHNVHRKAAPVASAVAKTESTGAFVLLMQEICYVDFVKVRDDHPDWTGKYLKGDGGGACVDNSGVAAFWTQGSNGGVYSVVFENQDTLPNPPDGPVGGREARKGMVCVTFQDHFRACSVHLANISEAVSTAQASEIKAKTSQWINGDKTVILGGDFNMIPSASGLNSIYTTGSSANGTAANGRFLEFTKNLNGNRCRCGEPTTDTSPRKIDYVFVSELSTTPTAFSFLNASDTDSDHWMLNGRARLTLPS